MAVEVVSSGQTSAVESAERGASEMGNIDRNEQLRQMNIVQNPADDTYYYHNPNGSDPVALKDENGNAVKDSVTALRVAPNFTGQTNDQGTPNVVQQPLHQAPLHQG